MGVRHEAREMWYTIRGMNKRFSMEGLLPPPVGTSDWARFSRDSHCVDKTLILKFGMAFYKKNLVVCRDLP